MRILQIAPPWFSVPPDRYGGVELMVAGLADGLVDRGHYVTLLASGGSRTRARLRTVYERPPSESLGNGIVEIPHVLAGYRQAHRHQLVHDHTVVGLGLAAMLGTPPVVHTIHGDWTPPLTRLYRQVADRVSLVAISHDQAARAPAGVDIAGVVHNGIDLHRYPFAPAPRGHLAFLGRAGSDKGADLAVEVARRLGRPLRMGIKVNEAAEREWWHEVFEPLLETAGDHAPVHVVRNATHAQKLDVLAGADALLFPIRWDEPFGLVMAEANACGTPVVAFARGAAPEVVADGTTGWLVAADDVDAMCAAVERVPAIDRRACRQRVADRFTTAHMVDAYVRLYERVTQRRPLTGWPDLPAISAPP